MNKLNFFRTRYRFFVYIVDRKQHYQPRVSDQIKKKSKSNNLNSDLCGSIKINVNTFGNMKQKKLHAKKVK